MAKKHVERMRRTLDVQRRLSGSTTVSCAQETINGGTVKMIQRKINIGLTNPDGDTVKTRQNSEYEINNETMKLKLWLV